MRHPPLSGRPLVVGIDPGGQNVGIVARVGDRLHGHVVLRRNQQPMRAWVDHILYTLSEDFGGHLYAIEDLNDPNPHMGITSTRGLIDTAVVIGALQGWAWTEPDWWERVVMVPPGGHGSAPLQAYPEQLRGKRETKGTGVLRHARSAWDVAHVGSLLFRADHGITA